ncbi:hypothetical protein JHK87_044741 [Glycine soja]|nr:hypothetical protein JHK87_044741 [Glycine soja]
MPAREITGLNYLLPSDPCPYPSHYNMVQNTIPTFELHKLSNQFYAFSALLSSYENKKTISHYENTKILSTKAIPKSTTKSVYRTSNDEHHL